MNLGIRPRGPLFPIPLPYSLVTARTKARFFAKIKKLPSGCWEWTGWINRGGYGEFFLVGHYRRAHRFSYLMANGWISPLTIDHLCRNRGCVNPAHLEQVTIKENIHRGIAPPAINARKTSCDRGHSYTSNNTMIYQMKDGNLMRTCRQCDRINAKAKRARPHNKERIVKYQRSYRAAHLEESRKYDREYKQAHYSEGHAKILARAAEYRQKNREKLMLWQRQHRQKLREQRTQCPPS